MAEKKLLLHQFSRKAINHVLTIIVLSVLPPKIMESIVRDSILDHVTVNCLLSPTQHGFTVGKSCITQLLTAVKSNDLLEHSITDVI